MLSTFNNRLRLFLFLTAAVAVGTFQFLGIGIESVSANNTPQTLPFSQDWTTNLITANDDWTPVPGIVGFLGDDTTTTTANIDPRTILTPFTTQDVIANLSSVSNTAGGVGEFDGIANPTIGLQGSGTADAPHIILYLNTTGQNNIRVSFNARDIDNTADNAIQQINTQYRIGGIGNFINVPGGYIADATTGPSQATLVTPVAVTLPAAASNQSLVEVRIMTSNAGGSDEWVGIDDISVTTTATAARSTAPVDFNGDGRTDYAVIRNVGGANNQLRWFYNTSGTNAATAAVDWGVQGDVPVPEDYDGDGRDDIAVWRGGAPFNSFFYILQSQTNTVRIEAFGQAGDNPTVVDDYDNDGKADPAVYRPGAQGVWYYLGSNNNPSNTITYVPWGTTGDRVAPGDYDGDGRNDFVIARNENGSLRFWLLQTTAGTATTVFGLSTDAIVPGDYDGDGKTDLAVARLQTGSYNWYFQPSSGGDFQQFVFGTTGDTLVQGDYEGDGKTDIAIWRPTDGTFWVRNSSSGAAANFTLGSLGDIPAASYNTH